MKPISAEFVTSVAGGVVPAAGLPIVALVGRSNVGKSSLINALVKRRIARSGGKPGTTRLVNVYRVATPPRAIKPFLFVDLPGYGYARGGGRSRQEFDTLTRSFFDQMTIATPESQAGCTVLAGVLLVVDVRHPGLESDVTALRWTQEQGYPAVVVATKTDRLSRTAAARQSRAHLKALADAGAASVPLVTVSTATGDNLGQVWTRLKELL